MSFFILRAETLTAHFLSFQSDGMSETSTRHKSVPNVLKELIYETRFIDNVNETDFCIYSLS